MLPPPWVRSHRLCWSCSLTPSARLAKGLGCSLGGPIGQVSFLKCKGLAFGRCPQGAGSPRGRVWPEAYGEGLERCSRLRSSVCGWVCVRGSACPRAIQTCGVRSQPHAVRKELGRPPCPGLLCYPLGVSQRAQSICDCPGSLGSACVQILLRQGPHGVFGEDPDCCRIVVCLHASVSLFRLWCDG